MSSFIDAFVRTVALSVAMLVSDNKAVTLEEVLDVAEFSLEEARNYPDATYLNANAASEVIPVIRSSSASRLVVIMMTGTDPSGIWKTPIDFHDWTLMRDMEAVIRNNHQAITGQLVTSLSYSLDKGFSILGKSMPGLKPKQSKEVAEVFSILLKKAQVFGNRHAQLITAMCAPAPTPAPAADPAIVSQVLVPYSEEHPYEVVELSVVNVDALISEFPKTMKAQLLAAAEEEDAPTPEPVEDPTKAQLRAMAEEIKALKAENEALKAELQPFRAAQAAAKAAKAHRDMLRAAYIEEQKRAVPFLSAAWWQREKAEAEARALAEKGPTRSYAEISAAASAAASSAKRKPFLNAVIGQVSKAAASAGGGK